MNTQYEDIPVDYRIILRIVSPKSNVLDLGCGEGELLSLLIERNKCRGQGIEINDQDIYKSIARGLSVFHGDIDSGLADYGDHSFDYVILNQSLQEVQHIESVLNDALLVGSKVIIGFSNFAYVKARFQIFFKGTTPITPSLPYRWYDTPNLHFLSIREFKEYCEGRNIIIEKAICYNATHEISMAPNLRAKNAIFHISQNRCDHGKST